MTSSQGKRWWQATPARLDGSAQADLLAGARVGANGRFLVIRVAR